MFAAITRRKAIYEAMHAGDESRVLGESLWPRFNGGAEGTRWYYGALADVFSQALPGRLADRL